MNQTKIEWCDAILNPVIGATKSCEYCYERRINECLHRSKNFFEPEFFPERLKQLYSKKSKRIFMDSMSDIADWKAEWIFQTLKAIENHPQHTYLFLTKRPLPFSNWSDFVKPNIWCGITVNADMIKPFGAEEIMRLFSKVNWFFNMEPLMGPTDISKDLNNGLKWIILGAETGNRKGKITPEISWIRSIVKQADSVGIPVFMKNNLKNIVPEEEFRTDFPV